MNAAFIGFDMNFRLLWRLVRCRYPSEIWLADEIGAGPTENEPTFDLPGAGFLVQSLRVALLHDSEGSVDEDLDERQIRFLVEFTSPVPVCTVRRDESSDRNAARVCEQLGDLCERSIMSN